MLARYLQCTGDIDLTMDISIKQQSWNVKVKWGRFTVRMRQIQWLTEVFLVPAYLHHVS